MVALTFPGFDLHPLSLLSHLIGGTLTSFVASSRRDLDAALRTYLFGTYDAAAPSRHQPFTGTPGVAQLNHLLMVAGGALLAAVFTYSALRTVVSAGDARHHLQVVLPRVLVALALGVVSLPLLQQAVNLNNALSAVVAGGGSVSLAQLPWASPLSGSALQSASTNIFLLLFAAALVVAVVILVLAYVVRYTLLAVLCAAAPLAAIAWVLPETRAFSRQWLRLLVITLFMQFVQLLVLRSAVALAFARGHGVIGILYAFAALYLMLRVPGALNVASHYGASAESAGRRWARAARRLAASEL
ncbi:MAG TPA: conjugal transfer protein TrbL family protein [Candidatus Dormibacteraeota bacterium]|nr:conjugal transfer protein TrbL family protein [Candidatus Dormibacteraeota bacterium]